MLFRALSGRCGGAGGIAYGFEVFDYLGGDAEALFQDLIRDPLEIFGA